MSNFHDESMDRLPKLIREGDRVLDVGGWFSPLNRADYLIDVMPYETRNQGGSTLRNVWPKEAFRKETYCQKDLCDGAWPFPDKYFDFVYCSNTLEDLRDPIHVCKEINRVGKRGFIEVPSRLVESTKGVERPFYCGYYHHRWLCEVEGTRILFTFKPAMLHAYRRFHFKKPWYKKINPKYGSIGFFWEGSFSFEEKIIIDRDEVQDDLLRFRKSLTGIEDLLLPKYDYLGRQV